MRCSFAFCGPAVRGVVELDAGELQLGLEEDAVAELREIDRGRRLRRRAGLLRALLGTFKIVDLEAEVVEAVAVWVRVRRFLGALPADDGDVDVAIGEVDLARKLAVA